MKERSTPNPAGRHGKPIILPPIKFEDAVRKALATETPKELTTQKPQKKKAARKR
jgi:hypothetical protein